MLQSLRKTITRNINRSQGKTARKKSMAGSKQGVYLLYHPVFTHGNQPDISEKVQEAHKLVMKATILFVC